MVALQKLGLDHLANFHAFVAGLAEVLAHDPPVGYGYSGYRLP